MAPKFEIPATIAFLRTKVHEPYTVGFTIGSILSRTSSLVLTHLANTADFQSAIRCIPAQASDIIPAIDAYIRHLRLSNGHSLPFPTDSRNKQSRQRKWARQYTAVIEVAYKNHIRDALGDVFGEWSVERTRLFNKGVDKALSGIQWGAYPDQNVTSIPGSRDAPRCGTDSRYFGFERLQPFNRVRSIHNLRVILSSPTIDCSCLQKYQNYNSVDACFGGEDILTLKRLDHVVSRMVTFGDFEYVDDYLRTSPEANHFLFGVNEEGRSALSLGSCEKYPAVTKLLLDHGAKLDHQDNEGRTPLMEAALWGRIENVNCLLEHGANRKLRDSHSHRAVDFAGPSLRNDEERYQRSGGEVQV